jgi:TPR repeat protein
MHRSERSNKLLHGQVFAGDASGAETINISGNEGTHGDTLAINSQHGSAVAQFNYGICLRKGDGVLIDLRGAAHYFKLAADQGFAAAQSM